MTSCSSVTSSISRALCEGFIDKHGRRCSPDRLKSNASQEEIFKTFTYGVFDQGRDSHCVPFDFNLENGDKLTVYSYFACNYGLDGLDERTCRRCMHRAVKNLRGCLNSAGAVSSNKYCCVRYETYNMCLPH
ncbi:hypothetical protein LINGRAHAP2_LOCUS8837 [Linum grandiflorum]